MNLQRTPFQAWLVASLLATAHAFSPNIPSSHSNEVDSSILATMAQYEAALKIALASAAAQNDAPNTAPPFYSDMSFLQHIDEQHEAMEKYDAALKAALASTHAATLESGNAPINTHINVLENVVSQQQIKLNQRQSWDSLTQEIHDIINEKESTAGKPISEDAKDEIIATAIAGSVLGAAVGSPLLVGVVLGFAGTQMLHGQDGDKHLKVLGNASRQIMSKAAAQASAALAFTKEQWEEEQDLSTVSKKILKAIEANANAVHSDVQAAPGHLVRNLRDTVKSEDFRQLPNISNLTVKALRDFMGSAEVRNASKMLMQAIQEAMQSEPMKGLQNRASQVVNVTLGSKK